MRYTSQLVEEVSLLLCLAHCGYRSPVTFCIHYNYYSTRDFGYSHLQQTNFIIYSNSICTMYLCALSCNIWRMKRWSFPVCTLHIGTTRCLTYIVNACEGSLSIYIFIWLAPHTSHIFMQSQTRRRLVFVGHHTFDPTCARSICIPCVARFDIFRVGTYTVNSSAVIRALDERKNTYFWI